MKNQAKVLAVALVATVAGAVASHAASPPPQQSNSVDKVVNEIIAREREFVKAAAQFTPRVETYIQEDKVDKKNRSKVINDYYFLGRMRMGQTVDEESMLPGPGFGRVVSALVFFALGLYGGALQAGVGIPLVFALVYAGHDLVRANAIKVAAIASLTGSAIPVFALEGQIAWVPALILGAGFAVGADLGVRLAVAGGERLIRPVLGAAVVGLAGHMLGFY